MPMRCAPRATSSGPPKRVLIWRSSNWTKARPMCCCSSRRSRPICRRASRWCRRKRRGSPIPRLYSRRSAAAGGTGPSRRRKRLLMSALARRSRFNRTPRRDDPALPSVCRRSDLGFDLTNCLLRCSLQLSLVLLDDCFKPRNVLDQAIAGETEKVIAELRILEIDFEQPVVGDGQHLPALDTFDGLRPFVVGRDETKLPHETPRRQLDADFGDEKFSGDRQVHLGGR